MIGCYGKITFSTYASARKAAIRMRRKKDDVVEEYKCRECSGYHVGHPSTESLQRKKQKEVWYERAQQVGPYDFDEEEAVAVEKGFSP